MNRKEFAAALKGLNCGPWRIMVNEPSDGAMQRGCYLENGMWKVYENDAKGRTRILYKNRSEDKAFAWLYRLLTKPEPSKKWYEFWKR